MRKNKKFIQKFWGINNISFLDNFPINVWSRVLFFNIPFISVNFFFSGLRTRSLCAPGDILKGLNKPLRGGQIRLIKAPRGRQIRLVLLVLPRSKLENLISLNFPHILLLVSDPAWCCWLALQLYAGSQYFESM
jgi:hypothetical protein